MQGNDARLVLAQLSTMSLDLLEGRDVLVDQLLPSTRTTADATVGT